MQPQTKTNMSAGEEQRVYFHFWDENIEKFTLPEQELM